MMDDAAGGESAFGFSGSWREYAPIAFTNLLLTIVTLGIYAFWARARTRRYLWSRTRFIDDRLHWTGTGLELFLGYLLAIVLFFVPAGLLNLLLQGVLMRAADVQLRPGDPPTGPPQTLSATYGRCTAGPNRPARR